MRKVIVNNIVSLDGHYADESGSPLALNMDAAFDEANLDSINAADMVLLGRDSYGGFSEYWPYIADAPVHDSPGTPGAGAFSEANRALSRRYNVIPKVVVSDRGPIPAANAWAQSTTVVSRADAPAWISGAKRGGDGDIIIFGSRRTWNGLLAAGFVDELHLMVSPVVLATGVRLFTEAADLELIECRRYEESPNVQLRYRVNPSRS